MNNKKILVAAKKVLPLRHVILTAKVTKESLSALRIIKEVI
jgi:hypothetical protein